MAKYYYLGADTVNYKDRNGENRIGHNLFIGESVSGGIKPLLRYDQTRKTRSLYFVSDNIYRQLAIPAGIKVPAPCNIYFDQYANISAIQFE